MGFPYNKRSVLRALRGVANLAKALILNNAPVPQNYALASFYQER